MPTVKPGVVPACCTAMPNPPWLFDDPQAVVAGLQSNVPVRAPLIVAVQVDDCPGVVIVVLPPQDSKAAARSAGSGRMWVPLADQSTCMRGGASETIDP